MYCYSAARRYYEKDCCHFTWDANDDLLITHEKCMAAQGKVVPSPHFGMMVHSPSIDYDYDDDYDYD